MRSWWIVNRDVSARDYTNAYYTAKYTASEEMYEE
jgi:hypothetical protein